MRVLLKVLMFLCDICVYACVTKGFDVPYVTFVCMRVLLKVLMFLCDICVYACVTKGFDVLM